MSGKKTEVGREVSINIKRYINAVVLLSDSINKTVDNTVRLDRKVGKVINK